MKWLIRLMYLCSLLTIVAVIAPIAYFVLAFGLLLVGSTEHILASTIFVYGLAAVPFFAAPALVVLGITLSVGTYFVGRKQGENKWVMHAKICLLVQGMCGLMWLATLGAFGLFPD